jgi:hypothetical protein
MEFHFGSGAVFAKPVAGNISTNPTYLQFGELQDVTVDISYDTKMLYGQKQFPDALARGKGKITCKAKFADFKGKMINDLFFGQTIATGQTLINFDFAANGATTVTITPPASGVFVQDLGVRYANGFIPFTKVASAPAVGQYSVNEATGVYTMNATDVGVACLFSYSYSVTTGFTATITNQLMGFGPTFEVHLYQNYNTNQGNLKLFNCVGSKLSLQTKQDDFVVPEFDFDAFADASGNVMKWFLAQ